MKKSKLLIITLLLVFISILFVSYKEYDDGDDFDLIKNLEIYHSVLKEIRINYVDKVNVSKLITFSIEEMLKQLDPFTIYYPEDKVEDYTFMNTGEYGGIGATVEKINNSFIITDLILDMAANKAGIEIGNEIIKIEDKSLENKSIDDVGLLLKGESGSIVNLKIKNGENKIIEYSLTRENVQTKNVTYYKLIENDIAYIKLENFMYNASNEVREALVNLNSETKLKGVILDLRANPGGLLTEAVAIVNLFVPKDIEIVTMKGQAISSNKIFSTTSVPFDILVPVTVIVNAKSASASEIVAGSLQDLDRAVIIGQRSYGKGLVQITKDLIYNTKIKTTIAKYYIPSGRCIQANDAVIRDKNHKIIIIPDSILHKFSTKAGRIVFDGAGIYPDIYINELTEIEYIDSLNSNFIFFRFANDYHKNNKTAVLTNEFKVTDDIYNQFIEFANKNFIFKSQLNLKLIEVENLANEKKISNISTNLSELKIALKNEEANYLTNYKTQISKLIGQEIVKHYLFKNGTIEYDFKNSEEILKAIEILKNTESYNNILK